MKLFDIENIWNLGVATLRSNHEKIFTERSYLTKLFLWKIFLWIKVTGFTLYRYIEFPRLHLPVAIEIGRKLLEISLNHMNFTDFFEKEMLRSLLSFPLTNFCLLCYLKRTLFMLNSYHELSSFFYLWPIVLIQRH